MSEQIRNISLKNETGYKTEIVSRNHLLISDEPAEKGGTDTGADPYELLLSSLGACKAITMRMYAERKNYPLKDIIINLSHKKIQAEDCIDCQTKEGMIDKIEIDVSITGELDDEQKKRLMMISDKCPVQKSLHSEIKIVTKAD